MTTEGQPDRGADSLMPETYNLIRLGENEAILAEGVGPMGLYQAVVNDLMQTDIWPDLPQDERREDFEIAADLFGFLQPYPDETISFFNRSYWIIACDGR